MTNPDQSDVEPNPRSVAFAAVVAVALFALSVPAVGWQFAVPQLGLDLEPLSDTGAEVKSVEAEGSAAAAGIEPGDTLLAVGPVSVPDAGEVRDRAAVFKLDLINRYKEGEAAEWIVLRAGERQSLTATFVGSRSSNLVSRVVVFGVFWAIACFLLWARSDRKHVRHLAYTIFALTPSVLFLANRWMALDTPLGVIVYQAYLLGGFLGPALLIHFGVIFPVPTLSDRTRRRVLRGTYGLYFVASYLVGQAIFLRGLLSTDAPYALMPPVLESLQWNVIGQWLHIVDFIACGGFMLISWRRLEAERLRDQIKWVLWAVLLTGGIDLLANAVVLWADGVGGSVLYPYRNYLYLLIAAGLLVAIFRHDLFDVDRVIRGTVIYFSTTGALFALFAATEAVVSEAVQQALAGTRSGTIGTAAAAILSGAFFQPLRNWIRQRTIRVLPVDPEEEVLTET